MKLIFTLAGIFFIMSANAQMVINDPNAEVRTVAPFNAIKVSGGIEILLTKGNQQAVVVSNSVTGNNSAIKTEVKGGELYIYSDNDVIRLGSRGKLRAYISYDKLESIKASGACDIRFAETINSDKLSINLSGASNITADININRLIVELSGASDAKLSGNVNELNLNSSGASDFKSYNLNAKSCVADISGASDARVTITGRLKVTAAGASNFYYKGSPANVEASKTGSSNVSEKN